MASMLPPIPAMAWAAPATASGGTGRPRTMTWCGRPAGAAPGPGVDAGSTPTDRPPAPPTSVARRPRGAIRAPPAAGGASPTPGAPTTTPSTRWPCTTTCSTSRTSTCGAPSDDSASAANSRAVTPGRSTPETVSTACGAGAAEVGGTRGVGSSGTGSSCRIGSRVLVTGRSAPLQGPARGPLSGGVGVVRTLARARAADQLAGVRLVPLAGVRLRVQALEHVRVVQLERGSLRTDPRELDEVVPRRRGGRGPLERVAVAPRVVT